MAELGVPAQVRTRWSVSVVLGVIVGTLSTLALAGSGALGSGVLPALPAGALTGWITLALCDVVWVLAQVWRMDAAATRAHATAEDPGRKIARFIAVLGSLASLAAVAVVIVQTKGANGVVVSLLAGLTVLSVVSSWALIHVNYMLHYARLYYEADPHGDEDPHGAPSGGITFNQAEPPEYSDFVYFAVGLGMTYQVSDTNITRNAVRRVIVAQTLLAYLFGAGFLAVTINLIAGLG